MNLLQNPGFEANWSDEKSHRCLVIPASPAPMYEKDVGNVFTPPGWKVWFRHTAEYAQPEVQDAWVTGDARRVHSGEKALKFFTYGRCHDGGVFQQVTVETGAELRLTAWIHAWSNHEDANMYECWKCFSNVHIETGKDFAPCPNCGTGINRDCLKAFPRPDDGRWSEGAGDKPFSVVASEDVDDNQRNFTFVLGIDPAGGTNPLADSVVWGEGKHIYNEYSQVPPVEATAQSNLVTVFVRSTTLWPFKHNDFYLDDMFLVALNAPEPQPVPQPEPAPVEWNYPVIEKGSKLGVHALRVADVLSYVETLAASGLHFPVVKAVDDLDWLIDVRRIAPETITVGRLTSDDWERGHDFSEDVADKLIGLILDKLELNPALRDAIDLFEPINEPLGGGTGPEQHVKLARLMDYCMEKAEAHGLKLLLPAFNAGAPEWADMVAMVGTGVFARMREGGHVLSVHEGVFTADDPIDLWWDTHNVDNAGNPTTEETGATEPGGWIPGSPVLRNAGALNGRYRFLLHLLRQRGESVAVIISEWCGHGPIKPSVVLERVEWEDELVGLDPEILAFLPFTLGPVGNWDFCDYARHYPALVRYMIKTKDRPNALPPAVPDPPEPEIDSGDPREQYRRLYVLASNLSTKEAKEIIDATFEQYGFTFGVSADDAGLGRLRDKIVIAIRPSNIGTGLTKSWYDEHYPGTIYWSMEPEQDNLYQLRGMILAYTLKLSGVELAFPITGEKRITDEFGRWRGTYYHSGLDLAGTWTKGHQVLAAYEGQVIHAGPMAQGFGETVRVLSIAPDGREFDHIYAHLKTGSISVKVGDMVQPGDVLGQPDNTGYSQGDHLHFQVNINRERIDPALLLDWSEVKPEQPQPLLVGYHDGGSPFALIHCQVQRNATRVSCGAQNIVRLNWGYANGTGTLPPPEHADAWINAVVATIKNSPPALLWHFGNEINNPSEWPGGYPNPTTIVSPQYFVELYNAIAAELPGYPIAPAPLDPYNVVAQEFGQPGDPKDWAEYIYQHITRCDGICIHAKTQTNNPAEIISFAKFTHAPLVGRYLHLRTITDQLSWIPQRFKSKPAYITELNPQFRVQDVEGGWYAENTRWIHDSHTFISTYPEIRGIIYYRHDIAGDQTNYGLRQFPALIDAIENYIEREMQAL